MGSSVIAAAAFVVSIIFLLLVVLFVNCVVLNEEVVEVVVVAFGGKNNACLFDTDVGWLSFLLDRESKIFNDANMEQNNIIAERIFTVFNDK